MYGGESWVSGRRYFDPMRSTDGIYLKLQNSQDREGNVIFKGLDFNPNGFSWIESDFGFGNETVPRKLMSVLERVSDGRRMYADLKPQQQVALLDAVLRQSMENTVSFTAGLLFLNGHYFQK